MQRNDLLYEWYKLRAKRCKRCELSRSRNTVCFGAGDIDARLMLIGEAPGADEDKSGSPFVGRSGKLLSGILELYGVDRESCYITNIVKCRPPYNRIPNSKEINKCLPWLEKEVALVKPRVLVPLGATAMKEVFYLMRIKERGTITANRGRVFHSGDATVLPTFHPSYALRSPGVIDWVKKDLRKAIRYSTRD